MRETVERSAAALAAAPVALVRSVTTLFQRRAPPVGSRPGTLSIDTTADVTRVRVMWCTADGLQERDLDDPDELGDILPNASLAWVDVKGLADEKTLRKLAERFAIHPLALEDVVHVPQRPKADRYGDQTVVFLRMLALRGRRLSIEQLSVVVSAGVVVTFQERPGDVLDPVRVRLREGIGRIRKAGAGYLAYALMDTVVDSYFPLLEELAETLEHLEDEVFERPRPKVLREIQAVKRTLMLMRRSIWPLREAFNSLLRDPPAVIEESTLPYLRDTYDHCVQVVEVSESYREMVGELTNTYMSVVSNRMNEVMKVLTVTASIFIPLTFLAGIYGMNFDNMPELHTRTGYYVLLSIMALLGAAMVAFFWHKGWLGQERGDDD